MSFDFSSSNSFQDAVSLKPGSPDVATHPLISVVTACFNPLKDGRKDLFLKSLDSVQQQIGVSLEHIIVDGASTDGTLEFLQAYNNKHHDIRILSMPDSGIYEAMNRGIALSRGKYVIFLNTDDFYHRTDGLLLCAEALDKYKCAFTFAPINPVGPHTRHSPHRHPQRSLHKFFVFCTLPHPSMMFRKTALLEIGGYDQKYRLGADYDMMLRLLAKGYKACFVPVNFVTFIAEGFSVRNKELKIREKNETIRNIHLECFGVELSDSESQFLVSKEYYPRKYLYLYVEVQRFIAEAFCGLPQDLLNKGVRRFNYLKYYLKSFFSFS